MGNLREQCTREQVEAIRNMIWIGRSGEYLAGWKWFARHSSENEVIIPQEKGGEFCEGAEDCHAFVELFYTKVAVLCRKMPEREETEDPQAKTTEPKLKRGKSTITHADNELTRFLEESGMTQRRLAKLMQMSVCAINNYATGRSPFTKKKAERLAVIRKNWEEGKYD